MNGASAVGESAAAQTGQIEHHYAHRDGELGAILQFARVVRKDGAEPEMRMWSNVAQAR